MRAGKLIEYLYDIIDEIITSNDYLINANFLDNEINSYSLDKIPTASTQFKFITGLTQKQDTYVFRSRFRYTSNQAEQLKNIGFFERFEDIVERKNLNKILPDIEGIQSVECLNCGSIQNTTENTCEMDIQIRITYMEDPRGSEPTSL